MKKIKIKNAKKIKESNSWRLKVDMQDEDSGVEFSQEFDGDGWDEIDPKTGEPYFVSKIRGPPKKWLEEVPTDIEVQEIKKFKDYEVEL